ncbi:uncharacterized protein M437DRAFT_33029, partial [Aureobasidium melanogenum CBS 110374]
DIRKEFVSGQQKTERSIGCWRKSVAKLSATIFWQLLARAIPALEDIKESKLSKHTIVEESLRYHQLQHQRIEELQKSVDTLVAERDSLIAEVNQWRRVSSTVSDIVEPGELCKSIARHDATGFEEVPDYTG